MVEVALLDTVRLEPPRPGYWGPGKAALWALLLGASLLAWAWDARWEERWEAWQLARRIKQRREGKRSFSAIENLDDILSLLLSRGVADAAARAKNTTDQQLGWQPLPNSPPGQPAPTVRGGGQQQRSAAGQRSPGAEPGGVTIDINAKPTAAEVAGTFAPGAPAAEAAPGAAPTASTTQPRGEAGSSPTAGDKAP
jgi:hypothetical protein